jgi:hypothetical protein
VLTVLVISSDSAQDQSADRPGTSFQLTAVPVALLFRASWGAKGSPTQAATATAGCGSACADSSLEMASTTAPPIRCATHVIFHRNQATSFPAYSGHLGGADQLLESNTYRYLGEIHPGGLRLAHSITCFRPDLRSIGTAEKTTATYLTRTTERHRLRGDQSGIPKHVLL